MTTTPAPVRNLNRYLVAGTAVAALLALAACTKPDPTPTTTPSTAASSAAPSRDEAESAKVLKVYNDLSEKLITLQATSDVDKGRTELKAFAVDPLLTQLILDLRQRHDAGLHNTGRPDWAAKITKIDTSKGPFTATIEDCYDATNYHLVKADGSPAGVPGQAKKYVVTSTATVYGDGKWYIQTSTADRSRTC